jgi:Lsr2
MAQRVEVALVDDLEGGPAARTVKLALDGVTYEIDLSEEHYAELAAVLRPYLLHGRRLSPAGRQKKRRRLKDDVAELVRDNAWTPRVEAHPHESVMRESGEIGLASEDAAYDGSES